MSNSFDSSSIFGGYKEPNIVKAQFILSNTRVYTLEFDQNISMNELKLMIAKAAHLHLKNFRIFSGGEEYTKYNNETFESLFHEQKLVVFRIELNLGEESEQTELLLQMNCPCNLHIDKFLLYYCYTCGKSICSDCFTIGSHQGHKIQDKCFYLLPSKFLVEKLFENWSQNPLEEHKYSEDQTLSELRLNINKIIFDKLFDILKNIQSKITNIIEQYHYTNYQLFERKRNSVRDIKVFCIKLLDDLKEKMNIIDIVNNEKIFIDFDIAYKKLGELQKEQYQSNYLSYTEFNQQIPILIKNIINEVNDKLLSTLNKILNDQRYDTILNQIKIKNVSIIDQEEISKKVKSHLKERYNDFTQKRLTLNYVFPNEEKNIKEVFENLNENKQRRKTLDPDNAKFINVNLNNNDNYFQKNNYNNIFNSGKKASNNFFISNIQKDNKEYPNLFNNNNNMSSNNLIHSINTINNIKENGPKIITTTTTTTTVEKIVDIKPDQISKGNFNPNLSIRPIHKDTNVIINENNGDVAYSSSAQVIKPIFNPATGVNSFNLQKLFSENQDNKQKTLLANNTLNDSFSSNSTINNINQLAEENIKENKFINHLNTQTSTSNNINNNEVSNQIISSYVNNNQQQNNNQIELKKNKYFSFGVNYRTIPEAVTESETEQSLGILKRFLNKEYILCPITQTNSVKLLTSEEDEITLPIKFSNNLGINSFLLDCAYCNYNKILYITGGNYNNDKTSIALLVNLQQKDQISKLSSMNISRACHSMIPYNKYLIVAGGENLSSVERYNILDNSWENLSPMNYNRAYPILVIYKEYLYAFFGKSNYNEYCNSIERIKLSNQMDKEKWEMVEFKNPSNIDTRLYGCGTHIINDNLYLLGGKCNEKTVDTILIYNFEINVLEKGNSTLGTCQSFRENQIHELGDKFAQISDNQFFATYFYFN